MLATVQKMQAKPRQASERARQAIRSPLVGKGNSHLYRKSGYFVSLYRWVHPIQNEEGTI